MCTDVDPEEGKVHLWFGVLLLLPGSNLHAVTAGGESCSAWLATVSKTEPTCFALRCHTAQRTGSQVARLLFGDRPWLGVAQALELQESVLKLAITQLIAVPLREALCNNHIFDPQFSRGMVS